MAIQFATAVRNARADAITTQIGTSGTLRIYSGTPPADPNTALSGNTLLAQLPLSTTFAGAASNGVLTANSITQDSAADNTGVASFFRILKSDGTTVILQGTVGTSGQDLNLTTTSITAGQPVQVTSFVLTEGGV